MSKSSVSRIASVVCLLLVTSLGLGAPSASAVTPTWSPPEEFAFVEATSTTLSFEWKAVESAPQYRIQLSEKPTMANSVYYRIKGTSTTLKSLDKNTTYYAKIKVIELDGTNLSAYTEEPVEASTAVTVPSGLTASEVGKTSLGLDWDDVEGAPGYRIQLSKSSTMSSSKYYRFSSSEGTLSGLDSDQRYYAKVKTITSDGVNLSPYSEPAISAVTASTSGGATSTAIPKAVTGLVARNITATGATIAWDKVSTAVKYRVYWSTSSNMASACEPTCKVITPGSLDEPSTALTGLASGKTYYIKVSAINASGKTITGWQTTPLRVNLETAASIPAAVEGLAFSGVSTSDATVFWDAVPTATRYRVYWSTSASMPGRCEPNCKIITPANASNPTQDLTQIMSPTVPDEGGSYYVKVSALNSAGKTITGWQATPLKVTLADPDTTTIPPSVQGLAVSDLTSTDATVSWNSVPTATRYRVYWSTSASMPGRCEPNCKIITPTQLSSPSQTLVQILAPTVPVAGRTYYVKVSALNASGKTITGWQAAALTVELPEHREQHTRWAPCRQLLRNVDLARLERRHQRSAVPNPAVHQLGHGQFGLLPVHRVRRHHQQSRQGHDLLRQGPSDLDCRRQSLGLLHGSAGQDARSGQRPARHSQLQRQVPELLPGQGV